MVYRISLHAVSCLRLLLSGVLALRKRDVACLTAVGGLRGKVVKFVVGKMLKLPHGIYRKLLYFDVHTYGSHFKHLLPEEIKWCQVFDVQSEFTAKGFRTFQISPLVCQLPAVSRDRGLSEAIATDFLFEAIQLVTCEITLSFLLAFFPPPLTHHLISPFFLG